MQERRLHARTRVHVDVQFQTAVVAASAPTHDLSPGGAFVETTVPLPVGTRLVLRTVAEGEAPQDAIQIAGRVVRTVEHGTEAAAGQAAGMGIQFEPLGGREREALGDLLRKHSPDQPAPPAAQARADEPGGASSDTLVDMPAVDLGAAGEGTGGGESGGADDEADDGSGRKKKRRKKK